MAVDLFIMSQGVIGNKMKHFFFFSFQGVTEPLGVLIQANITFTLQKVMSLVLLVKRLI